VSATLSDVTGRQQVVVIDKKNLLAGKKDFTVLYEFEDNPASNFVFSPDSKYLYGTSYYTGVSNIYRIRIETKEMEILSNAETGFFRPLPVSGDSLMFFNYTHEGMVPAIMKINSTRTEGV
jgi:Tol biopolymer transport system component